MTIYIEPFLRDPSKRAELSKALSIMHSIGFFPVLMEAGIQRAGGISGGPQVTETAAIQHGYTQGYVQCIKDIHDFLNTFDNIGKGVKSVAPDYGAFQKLKDQGFTDKEIKDALTSNSTGNTR